MKDKIERKNCMNCAIYEYHSHGLPEKIETEYEKEKDGILTEWCNRCETPEYRMWVKKQRITDRLVEEIKNKILEKEIWDK